MKPLVALILLLLALPLSADQETYITTQYGATGRFFTLLSRDCKTAYYLPRAYDLDARNSSVTLNQIVKDIGNDESVAPVLRLKVALRPRAGAITEAERADIQNWAARVGQSCVTAPVQVEAYPSLMAGVSTNYLIDRGTWKVVNSFYGIDSSLNLELEVDPKKIPAERLIKELDGYSPLISVTQFNLFPEAWARLQIDYKVVAEFALFHYTEQVCHYRQRCATFMGMTLWCRYENHCDDIPRVAQYVNDLQLNQKAKLSTGGTDERRIAEATEELLSRFMISNFADKTLAGIDGVTKVTLGKMHDESAGAYDDTETAWRIVKSAVDEDVAIENLGRGLSEKINNVYNSPRLKNLTGLKGNL